MQTIKIKATIGFNEGYFHNNENGSNNVSSLIQELCENEYKNSGNAVSFVYYPSKTIYLRNFGCPKGGEDTFTLETVANPVYVKDFDKWQKSVLNVIQNIKIELKQTTVTVEYSKISIDYLKTNTQEENNEK